MGLWEEVFGRRDTGYWWAPDSQAIAYLQSDESEVDLTYFVDFHPFSPRVIRQRYARAGRANPRVRLGISELVHDGTTWIQINDKPFEYIVRAKWLPDGKSLEFGDYAAPADRAASVLRRSQNREDYTRTHGDGSWLGKHARRPLLL
jgi:dipeptidyl-peptidase-4